MTYITFAWYPTVLLVLRSMPIHTTLKRHRKNKKQGTRRAHRFIPFLSTFFPLFPLLYCRVASKKNLDRLLFEYVGFVFDTCALQLRFQR